MSDLKPCPFCGGDVDEMHRFPYTAFRCCDCYTEFHNCDYFFTRPIEDVLRKERDEARVACAAYKAAADEAVAERDSLRAVVARVEAIRRRIITDGAVYLASEIGEILAYQPKVLATVRGWANKDDAAASFSPDRDQLGPNAVPVTAIFVERESNG